MIIKKRKKNHLQKTVGEKIFDLFNLLTMVTLVAIFLYPLLNMFSISISNDVYVLRADISFFPKGINTIAYDLIFSNKIIWKSMLNSVFVAIAGCFLSIITISIAAYPLSYGDFLGKKAYTLYLLFTMWFSGGIIPLFMTIRWLGLINSLWSLIINGLITAYYVIIVRNFFDSIPFSVVESAQIDGANDYVILFCLIIPLAKPVLATVALWIIVDHWNDYLNPLIFLSAREKYTLQLVLKDIVLESESSMYGLSAAMTTDNGVAAINQQTRNAVLVVSMVPMILVYPFLQRYFVSGIMLGAIKE